MIKKFSALMMLILILASSISFAQLVGVKTIPGDYTTIAAAIADLNTQGVGSGGVTFNVAAGYTESTTDSLVLTATGTISNPIVFQKSGAGLNPKITRTDIGIKSTSALGGQGDAVITIQGSDYVTFDGIDVAADSSTIEYGYYIRKGGPTDGCKFVTIKNATVSMNKGTSQYVVGIYSSNNDATSLVNSATGITVTSVDGRNENITITGNTIQNVFAGIVLRGFNHTTAPYDFYDQNFVVGQSGAGNTILNYAGNSANTAYGVYAIYQNNLNVSYNTINNTAGGGSGFTATGYGIFNSTGTLSSFTANFNDINLTTQATASAIYGINNAATGNLTIENNRIKINTNAITSGTVGYIYNSSAAASLQVSISSNVIVGSDLLTSSGALYLIYNNSSQAAPGITNVTGNSLDGPLTRTATSGATYCYYNNGSPTGTENIFNNVFDSITTAGSGALYGLLSTTGSLHTHHFYNNIISDFNHTGTGTVYGIHRTLASGSVYGNTVKNLTGGGTIWGLSNGSGNVNIYKNNVFNLVSNSSATTAGLVTGIYLSSLTNIYIYNNYISELKAPSSASVDAIRGIGCIATIANSNLGIYYNTIFLNATSSGANFGTSGIFHTYSATATSAALDMRNNVIVNLSTPNGAGRTVAFRRSAATDLNNYSSLSNNNAFYAGTPDTSHLIYFDGTNADQTLAQFKARVAPRESNSVTENVSFVNSTSSPYDLHINPSVPTQLESGGASITSPFAITDDFDGDVRGSIPDIGADEFTGIQLDLIPPSISYSPLLNTNSTGARTLDAVITDPSGVPTSGIGLPVLYWKINSGGTWSAATGTYVSGNNYQFSFGSGVSVGDTVFYYVVAQDEATTPNVGAYPTAGAGGFTANPPAAATPPTNPSYYLISQSALSGTYTVGLNMFNRIAGRNIYFEKVVRRIMKEVDVEIPAEKGEFTDATQTALIPKSEKRLVEVEEVSYIPMENGQPFEGELYVKKSENPELNFPEGIEGVYSTLTAAISDLNLRGVGGNVIFSLVDSTYPAETFPLIINISNENTTSDTKTVTIKPAASNVATISGASASGQIFKILNSYVTFDGSNSGGTDRSLTIENTSTTSPQVILIGSRGSSPISNVTVKNSIIRNGVNTSSAVIVSDGNTAGNPGYFNNITLKNNSIQKAYIGIYCNAVITAGNGNALLITENDLSATGTNAIRYVGIYVQGADGAIISKNTLANFDGASGENDRGIWFATGTTNSTIEGNYIHSLNYTGTSGYGAYGAAISTGTSNANIKIVNNVIYNLSGDGWSYTSILGDNVHGLYIFTTQSGVSVYYNSINLYGNTLNKASAISTGIAIGTGSTVELKNNNIVNKLGLLSTTGYGSVGIFLQTAGSQLSLSNYNNVFVSPTGSGVANFGQVATTGYTTLVDWQTATMLDNNSISGNPNYVSDTNLRFQYPSPVYQAGNPVPGITVDILGVSRNTTTPSIGAYENPVPPVIGWANLQWPPTDTIYIGGSTTVYAQIWIDGITNQPGPGVGIQSWIGVNSSNTDPSTWTTWIPATYNVDVGNNDEYMAAIGSSLAPGTYYYASRFNVFGGDYVYGGYNSGGGGFWDGINNVSGVLVVKEPLISLWQRSVSTTNLPSWFGADTERGLAYGKTSDGTEAVNERVFVVNRSGGLFVRILDAATGNDVGTLNTAGISGGTFALNDIGVTEDGKIIGANLTTNASTSAFKFYIWNNEASAPDTLFSYLGDAVRLGDKFTVVGNYSAGTAEIWAASATTGQHKVYKWTMTGGLFNSVPQVIQCSDNLTTGIASAAVGPLPNGSFYWNANGQNARKYLADGTLVGIIPNSLVATGSNAIRYLGSIGNDEYVATFAYGPGNNNVRVLRIPNGDPTAAVLYGVTASLGSATNTNGAGDVDFKFNNDLTVDLYVLATNNGVGAYRTDVSIPVELTSFAANVFERDVMLNWSTATETNNLGFEVERKTSSNEFWNKIAFIKSAGTTTEPQQYSYRDARLESGKYSYRLKIIDLDGSYSYTKEVEIEIGIPNQYALSQNYPNPFNPSTKIDYQLPFDARVQIELYSITGEKVATLIDGDFSAGYHTYELNASRLNLSSGIYFYRISAVDFNNGKFVDTKKLVLLK